MAVRKKTSRYSLGKASPAERALYHGTAGWAGVWEIVGQTFKIGFVVGAVILALHGVH